MKPTDCEFHKPNEHDLRLQGPQSVIGRLREYARVRNWPPDNAWPPESPMYAVLRNPGRATNTQSDGGMAAKVERASGALAQRIRAHEVSVALSSMPPGLAMIVRTMYEIPPRERVRSDRVVAEMLGMTRLQVIKAMERAYGWLAHELCLPEV